MMLQADHHADQESGGREMTKGLAAASWNKQMALALQHSCAENLL